MKRKSITCGIRSFAGLRDDKDPQSVIKEHSIRTKGPWFPRKRTAP
jgi:hypothetical protein